MADSKPEDKDELISLEDLVVEAAVEKPKFSQKSPEEEAAASSAESSHTDGPAADPHRAGANADSKAKDSDGHSTGASAHGVAQKGSAPKAPHMSLKARLRGLFLPIGRLLSLILVKINSRMGQGHTLKTRLQSLPGIARKALFAFAAWAKIQLIHLFGWLKNGGGKFFKLEWKAKLTILFSLVLGAIAVLLLKYTYTQKIKFNFGSGFFTSFEKVADARFEYNPEGAMEDFSDPISHPEYEMLIDKLVVNLKHPADGSSNPMGLFEFYLEASNQNCAVEIKDRQGEIRDVIVRNLEQMLYDDLITVEGKERLKVVLRKNVNSVLTTGQVRRIFFKTVVLKP
jgi:flagellar basal body-associated protein FliL